MPLSLILKRAQLRSASRTGDRWHRKSCKRPYEYRLSGRIAPARRVGGSGEALSGTERPSVYSTSVMAGAVGGTQILAIGSPLHCKVGHMRVGREESGRSGERGWWQRRRDDDGMPVAQPCGWRSRRVLAYDNGAFLRPSVVATVATDGPRL